MAKNGRVLGRTTATTQRSWRCGRAPHQSHVRLALGRHLECTAYTAHSALADLAVDRIAPGESGRSVHCAAHRTAARGQAASPALVKLRVVTKGEPEEAGCAVCAGSGSSQIEVDPQNPIHQSFDQFPLA